MYSSFGYIDGFWGTLTLLVMVGKADCDYLTDFSAGLLQIGTRPAWICVPSATGNACLRMSEQQRMVRQRQRP